MIYAVYVTVALVAFLAILNGFLRGAKKAPIEVVLSLLPIGLIAVVFFVYGWKFGLLAVVVAIISAIVTRPVAAQLASRLFAVEAQGSGGYVGLPPQPLKEISLTLAKSIDPDVKRMLEAGDYKVRAEIALLEYCEQQTSIQALLREFKVSRQDLQELYHQLVKIGAGQWTCGHWVAASALAYPESLRYLLMQRDEDLEILAYNLIMYFERGTTLEFASDQPKLCEFMRKPIDGFPWQSALSLLFPISATIHIATMTSARPAMVLGYGLGNLGYLLFGAGIWAGTFKIFGLKRRWQVLTAAIVAVGFGTVLSNIGT